MPIPLVTEVGHRLKTLPVVTVESFQPMLPVPLSPFRKGLFNVAPLNSGETAAWTDSVTASSQAWMIEVSQLM